ncbi:MAG: FAD-dependent oxidoreductase [Actinomycetota bacterium]|nr:FAD-dependent oxidoreductase [Euzebyaceae bacterium]MDQ3452766.1 FAD-dependent oxidoreductase [Actinomycetota bacterium]
MDTIIVGGGAIGLAVAWRAAEAGLAVTVVDPRPGRGATWAAAGMLAPVTEAHYGEGALLDLALESSRRWPSFAAELTEATGRDLCYRECGTVSVARNPDDNAALDELFAFQQRLGLDVQRLSGREVRSLEPALSPRVRGGILVVGDHQVDNRALVGALRAAAEAAGVTVRRERVTAVRMDSGGVQGGVRRDGEEGVDRGERGDRVEGVELANGEVLTASQVVLAAGAHSGQIGGVPPTALPSVRPVKGQLLHLRGPAPLATHNIRGLDVYIVPRADGRVVVGATVEELGFDIRVTAGAVHELLREAWTLLPGIAELELVEATAGLRPGSPDNAPLLGQTQVDGLLLATGHYRNGILLTPVTADGLAQALTGGPAEVIAACSPRRFTPAGALA